MGSYSTLIVTMGLFSTVNPQCTPWQTDGRTDGQYGLNEPALITAAHYAQLKTTSNKMITVGDHFLFFLLWLVACSFNKMSQIFISNWSRQEMAAQFLIIITVKTFR